jgi:hypothetical protein
MYQLALRYPPEISQYELHLIFDSRLAGWMEEVIEVESPVHFDEVARRMIEAAGVFKSRFKNTRLLIQAMNYLKTPNA